MKHKMREIKKISRQGLSAQDITRGLATNHPESKNVVGSRVVGSRVKKVSIKKQRKSEFTGNPQNMLRFLKTVIDAAADISGIPTTKLAEMFASDQVLKLNAGPKLMAHPNFLDSATEQRMAQIYMDIHMASIRGTSLEGIPDQDIIAPDVIESKGISQKDWIRSNINLEARAMFKVIECAVAAPEYIVENQHGELYGSVRTIQGRPDRLNRALRLNNVELNQCNRYAKFATEHGWMMLSILAHSAGFREAARTLDSESWESLQESINLNFNSLEYFAKIRYLKWATPIRRIPGLYGHVSRHLKQRYGDVTEGSIHCHPHDFIVPENSLPLKRPCHNGRELFNNTEECEYSSSRFRNKEVPSGWPAGKEYPSDPTITDGDCWICERTDCDCNPANSPQGVLKPLVELRYYGKKGAGICALQPIEPRLLLDEYVGRLYPPCYMGDPVYALAIETKEGDVIGLVSAATIGNWTRFINHSCDPNTRFKSIKIGKRARMMIMARREIRMFEELTVDYNDEYFKGEMTCQCGSPICRYPSPS